MSHDDINRCPLVPDREPDVICLEKFRDDVDQYYVYVEGPTVNVWQITGPNRPTPAEAIAAWNAAWAVKP